MLTCFLENTRNLREICLAGLLDTVHHRTTSTVICRESERHES